MESLHCDILADPDHVAALQARRMAGAAQVNVMSWIGLVLALGLGVYLVVALLLPEKFE